MNQGYSTRVPDDPNEIMDVHQTSFIDENAGDQPERDLETGTLTGGVSSRTGPAALQLAMVEEEEEEEEDDVFEHPDDLFPRTAADRLPRAPTSLRALTASSRASQIEYNRDLAAAMAAALASNNTKVSTNDSIIDDGGSGSHHRHAPSYSSSQSVVSSKTSSILASIQHKRPPVSESYRPNSTKMFGLGETVLVNMHLMNIANQNHHHNAATSTWRPNTLVNQFGFPPKEGRTPEEQSGPYLYVACAVRLIHIDHASQERSYTVERFDTGQRQRARVQWGMQVPRDAFAAEAAIATAKSHPASPDVATESVEQSQSRNMCRDVARWCQRVRMAAKVRLKQFLHGEVPFSCKVRCTGINLLVLCSTLFLFLQVVQLGWMPAHADDDVATFGTVIWVILVLELLLGILIRPKNYRALVKSDKAFRHSTVRHINNIYVVGEAIALLTYLPEVICMQQTTDVCLSHGPLARLRLSEASGTAVLGPTHWESVMGRLVLGSMAFRFFAVIRHWKQMLVNQTFYPVDRQGIEKWVIPYDPNNMMQKMLRKRRKEKQEDDDTIDSDIDDEWMDSSNSDEKRRLKSAANIGTALISVNCQRVLILMILSVLGIPLFFSFSHRNYVAVSMVNLLQSQNLVSANGVRDCEYLESAIDSWLNMAVVDQPHVKNQNNTYVLWAQVLPVRCPFQNDRGVITSCTKRASKYRKQYPVTCDVWDTANPPRLIQDDHDNIRNYFARTLHIRGSGISVTQQPTNPNSYAFEALNVFNVTVVFNQNPTITYVNQSEFFLLLTTFFIGLAFLIIIQNGVYSLALYPIQRMLRIVVRYAENPLWTDVNEGREKHSEGKQMTDEIGSVETEQLLNAITKISDLLRKCWGVAGAGIISSNLGREKDGQVAVFNPTVPGKQVYALFGFVTICGYSNLLKNLDGDIMMLINDIAKVVHDEVYRWALGEHGQCNKNLGPCFLMVWRIGDFNEVQKKNRKAIEKLFRDKVHKSSKKKTNLRRRIRSGSVGTNAVTRETRTDTSHHSQEIQLESLPGIQDFTDRALLGMLKSFAGIHRERSLTQWKNDPRLAFEYTVDIVYGMDAGWAVEGAVGSEYKIDATYLSPHVNMASRMMSAAKQYGTTILLSKAVEKLLSSTCRTKLRHIDCVYVKGSAVKQDIYTYDARYEGVDFFLYEKTLEQADAASESYTATIWDRDQDVRAMRQHVSDEFLDTYHTGVSQYLAGKWNDAFATFQKADRLMIQTVVEEGYIELDMEDLEDRIFDENDMGKDIVEVRHQFGDGACRTLMNYMERRNLKAPDDWDGVRQLFSK
eukprot:CAMPEP_0172392138 /NCGR_PEP_ID=MMETSP1061-20121228/8357_1 /TAXON_ID=37318 /ORGANISM="Pseudo-nitzschia pungens, Strain cf. pungens" /LENGTH=1303 /DNA_ID=CAMNT_0013122921 /DNA_START=516 /DNA_END=4427 /DNA_ORIENTATION=-